MWPIDKVKEFLEIKDAIELKAYDYCKLKKRSDLAVVLEEFVDTSKSVLDIGYTLLDYDFKGLAKTVF